MKTIRTATATEIARLGDALRDNGITPETNVVDQLGELLVGVAYGLDPAAAQRA